MSEEGKYENTIPTHGRPLGEADMSAATSSRRDEDAWFEQALRALRDSGPTGRASADYIERRRIRLGFSPQRNTGASWFDWRRLRFGLFLNADHADRRPDDPWLYGLLAHEAKHLEQGLMEALSVRGELVAWQLQYDILTDSSATPHGAAWRELHQLDPGSRTDLQRARALMQQIGGPGYRIGWLPLWPLLAEMAYRLRALFSGSG